MGGVLQTRWYGDRSKQQPTPQPSLAKRALIGHRFSQPIPNDIAVKSPLKSHQHHSQFLPPPHPDLPNRPKVMLESFFLPMNKLNPNFINMFTVLSTPKFPRTGPKKQLDDFISHTKQTWSLLPIGIQSHSIPISLRVPITSSRWHWLYTPSQNGSNTTIFHHFSSFHMVSHQKKNSTSPYISMFAIIFPMIFIIFPSFSMVFPWFSPHLHRPHPTPPVVLVAEALGLRPVQLLQRLARQAPARRCQLHTVDVARRRRRKEELQGHLSGAHTWDDEKGLYYQWIGLRENLQETIDFPIKYRFFGFSCKFYLKPIQWY